MKILHPLCLAVMYSCMSPLQAQKEYCATVPTQAELQAIAEQTTGAFRMPSETYTIKVVMYRIRHTNGSGAFPDSAFADQINQLNTIYQGYQVCFSLMKIVNVDNSDYVIPNYDPDVVNVDSMLNAIIAAHPPFGDALTMYILPPESFYRGQAFGIPGNSLIITSARFPWPVHLAHECGHCFGNMHTHADPGLAEEYVVRNCLLPLQIGWAPCCLAADLLCTTEASPNLSDTNALGQNRVDPNTCDYIDTVSMDPYGNLFMPNVDNIMSYAPFQCRDTFTSEQLDRMYFNLNIAAPLQGLKANVGTLYLENQIWSNQWRHEMCRDQIEVSGAGIYIIEGSATVMHRAENYIDLNPGFSATPGPAGYFVARAGDLCGNATAQNYTFD